MIYWCNLEDKKWYTYILRCADNSLYTGVTTDIKRRIEEHNTSEKGAKYTRARRPVQLAFFSEWKNRSEACSEETRIKKMTKQKKEKLVEK